MHDASGSKLNTWAWEGQWIGFDTKFHRHHIYWPMRGTVSVKWNVYFEAGQQLNGEPLAMPTFSTLNEQLPAPTPAAPDLPHSPNTPPETLMLPVSTLRHTCTCIPPALPSVCTACTHIPSCIMWELQSEVGIASMHPSNPAIL